MNFHIHAYPNNYWRFTPEAFKSLLKLFSSLFVDFAGQNDFPHTVIEIGFKSSVSKETMNEFMSQFKHCKMYRKDYLSRRKWKELVKPFIPQILLNIYGKILKKLFISMDFYYLKRTELFFQNKDLP